MRLGLKQFLGNAATFGELGKLAESNASLRQDLNVALAEYDRALERTKQETREGWVNLEEKDALANIRANVRQMYQYTDPLVKGAVNAYTKFCFQQGVDGPVSDEEKTLEVLTAFWGAPDNQQTMYSTVAQYRRSTQLLLDGSLFVMLRLKSEGGVAIRYLPVRYVTDIITDPLDGTRVLYYKSYLPEKVWDATEQRWEDTGKPKVIFYRDLFNTEVNNDPLDGRLSNVEEKAWVQHIAINAVDDAAMGIPEPATSAFWFGEHKHLAEDQATLSRVRASIANQLKVQGTAAQISSLQSTIEGRSQNTASTAQENLSGQVNILNQFAELELKAFGTGAADAWTNSRIFRIKALAGMGGLPLHFLSDPENANLATATAMERPALESFRAYQSIWVDAYRKQCDFVLDKAGIDDPTYDIPMPPVLALDVAAVGPFVLDAKADGTITSRQASIWTLNALGFDDVPKELKEVENEAEELEAEEAPEPAEVMEEESEWE